MTARLPYLLAIIISFVLIIFLRGYKLTKTEHSKIINGHQKAKLLERQAFWLFGSWMLAVALVMSVVWVTLDLVFK